MPVLNKHIFIDGCDRSGSTWLTSMFKQYADAKNKHIQHEAFRDEPLRTLVDWEDTGLHIVVGQSILWLDDIYYRFPRMQLAIILRDPVEHTLSVTMNSADRKYRPGQGLYRAASYWGILEYGLRLAEKLGVEPTYWHFDYFTTTDGFKDMAETLGVPLVADVKDTGSRNSTSSDRKLYPEQWPDAVINKIKQVYFDHEYVARAYKAARRGVTV